MSFYNADMHCMYPSPAPTAAQAAAGAQPKSGTDGERFFHHILDVINPLQHLPVVGTIYRAITGEHIGVVEKIAGDALYGGLWGAVGSVADVAFEAATGKDFGSTMLSLVTGSHDASTAVADAAPHSVSKGDFGDRLWAMLTGQQDEAVPVMRVAANVPSFNAPSLPSADMPSLPTDIQIASAAMPLPSGLDVAALTSALSAKGVDSETASRALYAYRRSMGAPAPAFASLN